MTQQKRKTFYESWKCENKIFNGKTTADNFEVEAKCFEDKIANISHQRCAVCRGVGLRMITKINRTTRIPTCANCARRGYDDAFMQEVLPIWIDDNKKVRYDLPPELLKLREGEKLLISPYLVYVPLHHMRKGQLAIKGHVCCFPQDVASVATELPRMPADTTFVKVVRCFKDETDEKIKSKHFTIRKEKVLSALQWLKKYSKVFDDILIQPSNLAWMGTDIEKELPSFTATENMNEEEYSLEMNNNDLGPSDNIDNRVETEFDVGGYKSIAPVVLDDHNKNISTQFEQALKTAKENSHNGTNLVGDIMEWPHVENEAINEYSSDDLFVRAFPWLYPGGIGDFKQFKTRKIEIDEWISIMIKYEDGRFMADKMWTFYALNYRDRLKNKGRGSFFVNKISQEENKTVEDIIQEVSEGNLTWIDKISYFNGQVKASPGYWREKKWKFTHG